MICYIACYVCIKFCYIAWYVIEITCCVLMWQIRIKKQVVHFYKLLYSLLHYYSTCDDGILYVMRHSILHIITP